MRMCKNTNPITKEVLETYRGYPYDGERSRATVEKYPRDVRKFAAYLEECGGRDEREVVNKDRVQECKQYLRENYKITSTSSMLTAISSFFIYIRHEEWEVQPFKIQRAAHCQPKTEMTRQDYRGLVRAAWEAGNTRMSMLLQAVGSTGIRISELKYIGAELLETERAEIYSKGKPRVVLLPGKLVDILREYCRKEGIRSRDIFITRSGNPVDRSNINRRMKRLAVEAGVGTAKVFPHNLRHLFAGVFYSMEKNATRLMDLLGHSSISTTRVYTAGTEEGPRHQLGRMNLMLG